jgi:ribosome maturation factor RimP
MKDYVVRSSLEEKFEKILKLVANDLQLSLYDFDFQPAKSLLTVFILNEKTKTATIEDCIKFDRAIDPHIENQAWVPSKLVLEVSSPGIERKIRTSKQFIYSIGEYVAIHLDNELGLILPNISDKNKRNKQIKGKLLSVELEKIEIEDEAKNNYVIPIDSISKAKQIFKF